MVSKNIALPCMNTTSGWPISILKLPTTSTAKDTRAVAALGAKYLLSRNEQFNQEAIVRIERQTVAQEARMMPALFEQVKKEGVEVGMEQGEKNALLKIAENLIREGMDIAKVCKMTELSREQIETLRNGLPKH